MKFKYGICSIIFDGHGNGPNTKDHEHKRRLQKSKPCPDITVFENISAYESQKMFLTNDANKEQKLLTIYLLLDGHHVEVSTGDVDSLIVAHALTKTESTDSTIVVVADDTDVFIVLLRFLKKALKPIMMFREPKSKQEERRLYNIKEVAARLKQEVLSNILAIHAWGGCDTTSASYGIGKTKVVKLVQQSEEAQKLMTVLSDGR